MKFGVNTFIWTAQFGPEDFGLLSAIREAGFDGIEIPIFRASEFPAAAIRAELARAGLEATVCTVLVDGLSFTSDDAAVRAEAVGMVRENIERVGEVGARLLVGPVYSPVGYLPGRRRTIDEWSRVVDCLSQLGDTLTATGVHLAIEPLNRFETFFLNTAADAVRLCEEVAHPNVGILFDTFHANIEEKNIADGYRTCGKHLKHVHTCENDRGTPGSGHVEWTEVFAALKEMNYDGWLTIESFGFALGEISAAASIWRDIERSPADIAFDGIKFLQKFAQV